MATVATPRRGLKIHPCRTFGLPHPKPATGLVGRSADSPLLVIFRTFREPFAVPVRRADRSSGGELHPRAADTGDLGTRYAASGDVSNSREKFV